MSVLSITDLGLQRNGKQILNNLNLTVDQGTLVTLVGKSGCGKSTLLKVIAGLIEQDRGNIHIDNTLRNRASDRLGCFGYMPQQDALLPWRNLTGNLLLGTEITGNRNYTYGRLKQLLPLFGLEGREHDMPSTLSGGMRRRAALLRTWLTGKQLLLLDEPFTGLDTFTQRDLQQWLVKVHQQLGTTIIFVTHDIDEAVLLADSVLVFAAKGGAITHSEPIALNERNQRTTISNQFIIHKKRILTALG